MAVRLGDLDPALIVNDSVAAKILRRLNPGWGWCTNCGTPWNHVDHHTTQYSDRWGVFPLCVHCWDTLGAEAKLHCYRLHSEQTDDLESWPDIAAALAAELGHRSTSPPADPTTNQT